MINLSTWTPSFLQALNDTFGDRLWFVGLQGSYSRGEATDRSDIDWVVILDQLTPADLHRYRSMLDTLSHRELLCGFFGGKDDLLAWEPSDLFQFYHDTHPIQGSLDALLPLLDDAAVARAIQIGACNIYHGCVHNLLYDHSTEILCGLYKSARFVIQAIYFRESGHYVSKQTELLTLVSPEDREILQIAALLKRGDAAELAPMSERLFLWAQKRLKEPR